LWISLITDPLPGAGPDRTLLEEDAAVDDLPTREGAVLEDAVRREEAELEG